MKLVLQVVGNCQLGSAEAPGGSCPCCSAVLWEGGTHRSGTRTGRSLLLLASPGVPFLSLLLVDPNTDEVAKQKCGLHCPASAPQSEAQRRIWNLETKLYNWYTYAEPLGAQQNDRVLSNMGPFSSGSCGYE